MRRGAALRWLRLAFLLVTVFALGIGLADRAPAAHLANNFEPDQCTWWVLHRLQETGAGEAADEIINWLKPRDANQWLDRARDSGWSDGTEPRVGAIAWWPLGDWGHVAYVEEVLDSGRFRVSEQNFPLKAGPRSDRILSVWDEVARGMRFIYPPVAQLEVTEGLIIDPVEVNVGESVTATFSLTNRGPIPAVLDRVMVSVRGPQPEESIVDFDFVADLVIQPQKSYRFESSRSFAQPGTYRLNIWIEASGRGEIPKGEEPGTQVETTMEVLGSAAPQPSGPNQATVASVDTMTGGWSASFECGAYTVTWSNPVDIPIDELPKDAAISIIDANGNVVFEHIESSWAPMRFEPGWCGDLLGDGTIVVGYGEWTGGASCCFASHLVVPNRPETVLLDTGARDIATNTNLSPMQLDGTGAFELTGGHEVLRYQLDLPGAVGPWTPVVLAHEGRTYTEATRRFPAYLQQLLNERSSRLNGGSFDDQAARAIEVVALYALLGETEQGLSEVRAEVSDDVDQWLDAWAPRALELIDSFYAD